VFWSHVRPQAFGVPEAGRYVNRARST
jgi:hypothetical protein